MGGLHQSWPTWAAIAAGAVIAIAAVGCWNQTSAWFKSDNAETFRLVYTSEGDEALLEKGLTQDECGAMMETYAHAAHHIFPEVVLLLAAGFGHLGCSPESSYADRAGSSMPARPQGMTR